LVEMQYQKLSAGVFARCILFHKPTEAGKKTQTHTNHRLKENRKTCVMLIIETGR
jgi:hypothetical protein